MYACILCTRGDYLYYLIVNPFHMIKDVLKKMGGFSCLGRPYDFMLRGYIIGEYYFVSMHVKNHLAG